MNTLHELLERLDRDALSGLRGRSMLLTSSRRDHSLVSDAIHMAPWMTEEEIRRLPPNVITRALGIREDVLVDLKTELEKMA